MNYGTRKDSLVEDLLFTRRLHFCLLDSAPNLSSPPMVVLANPIWSIYSVTGRAYSSITVVLGRSIYMHAVQLQYSQYQYVVVNR